VVLSMGRPGDSRRLEGADTLAGSRASSEGEHVDELRESGG